jgi:hypothetical protein
MYIATFFTHYGAIKFRAYAKEQHIACTLMPVPRVLSSSCGTCARYEAQFWDIGFTDEALEGIYRIVDGKQIEALYKAKEQ